MKHYAASGKLSSPTMEHEVGIGRTEELDWLTHLGATEIQGQGSRVWPTGLQGPRDLLTSLSIPDPALK